MNIRNLISALSDLFYDDQKHFEFLNEEQRNLFEGGMRLVYNTFRNSIPLELELREELKTNIWSLLSADKSIDGFSAITSYGMCGGEDKWTLTRSKCQQNGNFYTATITASNSRSNAFNFEGIAFTFDILFEYIGDISFEPDFDGYDDEDFKAKYTLHTDLSTVPFKVVQSNFKEC